VGVKVAVAHDYLTQRGGAERVASVILDAFPGACTITSLFNGATTFPGFAAADVRTSYLQHIPLLRRDPRLAFPLLRSAFDRLEVRDVEAVVCSSTGWAHGVRTDAAKIVYCHNPARWLYQPDEYLRDRGSNARAALKVLRPSLIKWDQRAAASAERYLVNSSVVRDRVRKAYGIEAQIVPPPVYLDAAGEQVPVAGVEAGYFVTIGRARGYKNVDIVRAAFRELPDQRLVIVGVTPSPDEPPWPPNVRGIVGLSDEQMRWLYANSRATISASNEDFGLTPIEGYAFGKPAVVLRAGGFLDTTIEGVTGTFIETLDPAAVTAAVELHLKIDFRVGPIVEHVLHRYTRDVFQNTLRAVVDEVLAAT
jgi:glycosyltransferase involved in cell wall biosynthesis